MIELRKYLEICEKLFISESYYNDQERERDLYL